MNTTNFCSDVASVPNMTEMQKWEKERTQSWPVLETSKRYTYKDARMNFYSHRYVKIRTCFGRIMDGPCACLTVCAHAVEFKTQNLPLKYSDVWDNLWWEWILAVSTEQDWHMTW